MASPYGLELVEKCTACKLRRKSFFCALPRRSLSTFEKVKLVNIVPKGTTLFVAGQLPTGFHVVCAGKVKLCIQKGHKEGIVVKVATAGEVLGLHACVRGSRHELTAETMEPSQITFVRRDDVLRLLAEDRDFCWKTAQALSSSCHSAYQMVRAVGVSHSSGERLARLLLELTVSADSRRPGARVKVSLTQKEIARAMGVSRETLWRKLSEFRKKRLAVLQGSTLIIQNRAALGRLAGA
jgi:CRP/FNR family transcriptional regulator